MPSLSTTEFAPAKINLTLHVTGQRADGYHLLDSLVVFCGIGDQVTVQVAKTMSLALTGPFATEIPAGADNLVMRAAKAFSGSFGFAITLEKNLPPSSGLGGGSADAAATIRAVLRLQEGCEQRSHLSSPEADRAAILALGADVPVCLGAQPARMRGIGERLDWLSHFPRAYIALVNPRVAVPTPEVFNALHQKQNPPMPDHLPEWPDAVSLARWLATQRNDLEAPARTIAPVIGAVLDLLHAQPGALMARMSGSGATCFALFATERAAQAAADAVANAQPGWWTAPGSVLAGPPNGPRPG